MNIANGKIVFNEDGSGSIAKQDSLLKEGITFDSEGNVRLGANVEYLGFESHYYMGPIIKNNLMVVIYFIYPEEVIDILIMLPYRHKLIKTHLLCRQEKTGMDSFYMYIILIIIT